MAKRPVPLYDFKAFGAAIKAARNEYGESRKKVSDELYISPRYLAISRTRDNSRVYRYSRPCNPVSYFGRSIFLPEQQCGEIHRAAAA